jgi:type II secretory pathway pseudopilin PulG
MVAMIIIALLATMILPKFTGTEKREFRVTVEQVSDLLTMFAQRETMEQRPVGIAYHSELHQLRLVVLESDPDNGTPIMWHLDPYVTPVQLPDHVEEPEIIADGEVVDIRDWPITATPGEVRPDISIMLRNPEYVGRVRMPAHAIVPEVAGLDRVGFAPADTIDLDQQGRSREDW